jgi:MFS family permease
VPAGIYRAALSRPGAASTLAASLLGRIPVGFETLAIVLTVREAGGSFALAGAAAAAFAAAAAVAAPVLGRRIDRRGQGAVLVPAALVSAAALVGLALCATLGAPGAVLVPISAVAGAAAPPISASMRALWPSVVPEGHALDAAYSLEAVIQEAVFIIGPLLCAALVALLSAASSLVAAAALVLVGCLWFSASRHSRAWVPAGGTGGGLLGALRSTGLRAVVAASSLLALAFGNIEVALPAFAQARGSAAWAGVLIAAMAVASVVGGLVAGARTWTAPLEVRYLRLFVLFALGLAPLALAGSLESMLGLMALGGLLLAPLTTCIYALVGTVALPGTTTEAFTWLNTAFVGGSAAGAALAGVIVDGPGVRAALLAAWASAMLAAGVAALRRADLARPGAAALPAAGRP